MTRHILRKVAQVKFCQLFRSVEKSRNILLNNSKKCYHVSPHPSISTQHYVVDLRSDTVTKPSAGMRKAMAEAEVGDDVYGEDPTINGKWHMSVNLYCK